MNDFNTVRDLLKRDRRAEGYSTEQSEQALEALDRILTRLRLLEAARDIQAMAYQPEENE